MTSFPSSIYSPRAKENRNGVVYDATKKSVIFKEDISKLDDEVVATETELERLSKVRAYMTTADQVIPDTTVTKVVFNAETFDTQNEFDKTTNYRFTALKAGYYRVSIQVGWDANATGVRILYLYRNGASISTNSYSGVPTDQRWSQFLVDIIYLTVGQYLEVYVKQTSGGNLNLKYGPVGTSFCIDKLPCL